MLKKYFIIFTLSIVTIAAKADPLPSWNDGKIKQKIIQFVQTVTDKSNPDYVEPENRIATFDNDGTLWLEQPAYTQTIFMLDEIKKLSSKHPEWKTKKPFSTVLNGDRRTLASLSYHDVGELLAATHTGMDVEEFIRTAKLWLDIAINPRFKRPYTKLIYQPMLEAMEYLRANKFDIYIVSGGGQEFIRAFAQQTYGISPSHIIGTTGKTKFTYQNGDPVLIKLPEIMFVNDKAGKPEAINLFIGKKPIISFGNSDGDREMLEWTESHVGKRLMLLVHHDDAEREYAYGPNSKIGTFSNSLMKEAQQKDWQVISMKNDWKTIFPGTSE